MPKKARRNTVSVDVISNDFIAIQTVNVVTLNVDGKKVQVSQSVHGPHLLLRTKKRDHVIDLGELARLLLKGEK